MELKTRFGFTLVELMVVIVIIGVLATVVVARYANQGDRVYPERVRFDFRTLEDSIDLYKLDSGRYPETLTDLLVKPADVNNWHGPYLKGSDAPRDPWGVEYAYDCIEVIGADYVLKSAGPNCRFDDEDDMSNVDPPDKKRSSQLLP